MMQLLLQRASPTEIAGHISRYMASLPADWRRVFIEAVLANLPNLSAEELSLWVDRTLAELRRRRN